MIKRILRLLCIDFYFLSLFGLYGLFVQGGYGPNVRVPVPTWYDEVAIFRNGFVNQWRYLSSHTLTSTTISGALVLLEGRRREFVKDWGSVILICAIFFVLWLFDRFAVQLV